MIISKKNVPCHPAGSYFFSYASFDIDRLSAIKRFFVTKPPEPWTKYVDIECTMQLLDNVIGYYEVSGNVEHIIEKGPGEGGIELDRYIDALNRLYNAQKYFEKNIPQSVELINVVNAHS